ncbi:MAG: hypothetical protein NVS2B17_09280 [Candidatus Velthaea sp.]
MTKTDFQPLSGRVAVVTGGGRGLGRAMVLGLAEAGCRVIATAAREQHEIDGVPREADDARVLPLLADVTLPADAERVVDAALERFGGLDILVNNARRGMKYVSEDFLTSPTRFWETDPATWRLVIDANVNGPFYMARAAVPHMLREGWGRIVNISMNHETMWRAGFSPYGPSKAALESETVIWAKDLAGTGVTVNALLPGGATNTGMIPAAFPAAARSALLDPAVVVPPLLWLATPASDGVSGARLDATRWRNDLPSDDAAREARGDAGWS